MKLVAPIRVVVIDDNADHLFAIANALSASGIPCIWHLYDNVSHTLVPAPPIGGYSDVRLIVTDLNIRNFPGTNPEPKQLGATLIADVLQPILPAKAVPYGLVFWSTVSTVVEEVCSYIKERIDHASSSSDDRRSPPLSIQLLKKGDFITDIIAGTPSVRSLITEAASNLEALKGKLDAVLNDAQLQLVCAWETRVSKAATTTVNGVYEAAVMHANSKEEIDVSTALQDVLAKISNEAAGSKNAKESPGRALDDGLIDLLTDDLRANASSENYLKLVEESLRKKLGKEISLSDAARYQLNTALHAETGVSDWGKNTSRGIVFGAKDQLLIANRLGYDLVQDLIWKEFLFPASEFAIVAKEAKGRANEAESKAAHEWAETEETVMLSHCKLRLVEVGADCDHANRKPRTVRLLCALEIPHIYLRFAISPRYRKFKSDAIVEFGPWNLSQQSGTTLLISIKRFTIEQKWPLPADLTPQYRLRRPIVDMLLHQYANHSSRLGYVDIRR